MKLPVGVYAVSADFAEKTGTVSFVFRDVCYEAQMGSNAFANMDDLTHAPLELVREVFFGYEAAAVVLVPAGELMLGTSQVRSEKFRTCFPCSVAVLGENVGIRPNEVDLRTPAKRRAESVLAGSFYFGCLAMDQQVSGTFAVDGITLKAKIYDKRTGGENVALEVKNTVIASALAYDLICAEPFRGGRRSTLVQDCRADGIHSRDGEGVIFSAASGSLTLQRVYVANTRKFLGLTDFSGSLLNDLTELTVRDCLFENSASTHGLTVSLPQSLALPVEKCLYYRVEITNESDGLPVAFSNPIWLD